MSAKYTPSKSVMKPKTTLPRRSTDASISTANISIGLDKISHKLTEIMESISGINKRLDNLERETSIQSQESKTSNIQLKEIKENTVVLTNIVQELESHASNTTFNQILNDECQKLKKENSVKWKDIMNRRKKSYWHCLQNFKKADLYSNWVQDSPSYLPLKYRVKVNSSDSETATQHKIEAAKSISLVTMKSRKFSGILP